MHLLQKIKANKPLTAGELDELKRYETEDRMQKTEYSKQKKKQRDLQGKFVKKATGHESQIASHEFAALAEELKNIAAIDSQLEEHFDLEKYPRVKAALKDAVSARIEEIVKQRFAKTSHRDYRRITLQQLIEITNKGRRTIYFWLDKGLPREDDGNFWLPKVLEWLEKYIEAKIIERQPDWKMNPYQMNRAKELDMRIAENEHRLLDRGEVLAGQIARHQNLVNSFTHKAEELAMLAAGQPQAKIMELLGEFFDGVLRQQCQVPEQLCLPEKAAEQFRELLESLKIKA